MTILVAQEDSGRTEAVSRRFGSDKKVNLVDGDGRETKHPGAVKV